MANSIFLFPGTLNTGNIVASGSIQGTSFVISPGSGSFFAPSGGSLWFLLGSGTRLRADTDSILLLTNAAGTDFDRLQLGGTTSSFPSLKRSSAALLARLADDSADAIIQCLRISTSSAAPMFASRTTLTNGAGASAGTLANAPSVGNPTKWIAIDDNGTTRQIPCW